MVNVNELRLGNWIMVAGTGELHPVQINIDNLRQLIHAPEYAAGVHLTPEILESIKMSVRYKYFTRLLQREKLNGKIEYLHQLQNLYFALTGTELPVDVKTFSEV